MAIRREWSRWAPLLLAAAVLAGTGGCAVPTGSDAAASSASSGISIAVDTAGSVTAQESTAQESTAAALPDCTQAVLTTRTPGVLTLATGSPLTPPWFTGTDPATSEGYEADVARKVAATLGFGPGAVTWVTVDPQRAINGAEPDFDVLIDQVRHPDANADQSSGYYSITDALVMPKTAAAALAGHAPDLARLQVGVIGGGTGETAIRAAGNRAPMSFAGEQAAVAAVTGGTVKGVVLPTPDALLAVKTDPALAVVGQLPTGRWQPDQFHLVLAKNSPLTPCVSGAVDRLRVEGTLDQLTQKWITSPLAPEIG